MRHRLTRTTDGVDRSGRRPGRPLTDCRPCPPPRPSSNRPRSSTSSAWPTRSSTTTSADAAVGRFRDQGIVLPTFAELADPSRIDPVPDRRRRQGRPDARNLFRVHWYNDLAGEPVAVPDHVVLPPALTGVESPIIVVFGDRFPMITAHKVLAAYACLAPRVDHRPVRPHPSPRHLAVHRQLRPRRRRHQPHHGLPGRGRAPGGHVAGALRLARPLGGRPGRRHPHAGHREQRQGDLRRLPRSWPRTPTTSCSTSSASSATTSATTRSPAGRSGTSSSTSQAGRPELRLAAFVSATGSAGTIAAGDRLKEQYGTRIVAVEALECPTMLENGFGEHNIQGIGDKHIPLIHNVMNTDVVVRGQRPGHRRARRPLQHRRRAAASSPIARRCRSRSSARSSTSGSRRSATCWPPSRR